jgi:hypothetical protein
MFRLRVPLAIGVTVVAGVLVLAGARRLNASADTLPERLTDEEFWKLSVDMSEPNGEFRSDNLLSNELYYSEVIAPLVQQVRPGRVYLGVGPEQNFNYIVAIRPKMAFITDIRRGNLHTQLMYKALFEMSSDRADFISRLFTQERPEGLTETSTVREIIDKYWVIPTSSDEVYKKNLQAIKDHLTTAPHHLPLAQEDLDGIERVYWNFYWWGLPINYNSSANNGGGFGGNMANYASLMLATDAAGISRSYLATDEGFRFMKDLESRNLIVPVVGNFGGPKALKAVGQYVRDHGATVSAFYLSNVEQYLRQDGIWMTFCANVASMPLDETSTFIRSQSGGGGGIGFRNYLGLMEAEVEARGCAADRSGLR